MKSTKMISLMVFIAIISFLPFNTKAASPKTIFLKANVTDFSCFEKCSYALSSTIGVVDVYFNNSNGILTILFDEDEISNEQIFDEFRKKGYKIVFDKKTSFVNTYSRYHNNIESTQNNQQNTNWKFHYFC